MLAPLCLPGPESMWASVVDGEKVWADLWPRSSLSPIGSYIDARTWEVLQVSALRKRMLNSDVLRPRKGDKGAIRLAKEGSGSCVNGPNLCDMYSTATSA